MFAQKSCVTWFDLRSISTSEDIVVGMIRKRLEASKVNYNDFDIFISPF